MTTKTPLSTAQVAELLAVSTKTVQRKAAAGEIPGAVKLPGLTGSFVFDADAIDEYVRTGLTAARIARRQMRRQYRARSA